MNQVVIQEDVQGENIVSEEGNEDKKALIKGTKPSDILEPEKNLNQEANKDPSKLNNIADIGFEEMAGTS